MAFINLKPFVKAKSDVKSINSPRVTLSTGLSGDEVEKFYLDILSSSQEKDEDILSTPVKKCEVVTLEKSEPPFSNIVDETTVNRAMRCAEVDDIESLKKYIQRGLSVNCKDPFGWSLLMVASYAGAGKVVKYLVEKKSLKGIRDSKGMNALYLATIKKHDNIIKLLIKNENKNKLPEKSNNTLKAEETYYCEECKETIDISGKLQHDTSISHLFNVGPGATKASFLIPPSNRGYQLLLNSGWNSERGLGPEGRGNKYPVKTCLKRDRSGLGVSTSEVKKVTHFQPKDTTAIERVPKQKAINKKSIQRIKQKEKLKEIHMRRAFNEPDVLY